MVSYPSEQKIKETKQQLNKGKRLDSNWSKDLLSDLWRERKRWSKKAKVILWFLAFSFSYIPSQIDDPNNINHKMIRMTNLAEIRWKIDKRMEKKNITKELHQPVLNMGLHSMSNPRITWSTSLFLVSTIFKSSFAAFSTSLTVLLYRIWPLNAIIGYLITNLADTEKTKRSRY